MATVAAEQPSTAAPKPGAETSPPSQNVTQNAASAKGGRGSNVAWELRGIDGSRGGAIAGGRTSTAAEGIREAVTAAREFDFSRELRRDQRSARQQRTGPKLSPAMKRVVAQERTDARRGAADKTIGNGVSGEPDTEVGGQPTGETTNTGAATVSPGGDSAPQTATAQSGMSPAASAEDWRNARREADQRSFPGVQPQTQTTGGGTAAVPPGGDSAPQTVPTHGGMNPAASAEDWRNARREADQRSFGDQRPEAFTPQAQMGVANRELQDVRTYGDRARQAQQDYRLGDRPLRGSTGPGENEQKLENLAKKEQSGNLSEQEKKELNGLRSSMQIERQAALAKEAMQARRILGQYGTRGVSQDKMLRISERGRGLARRLGEAGQEANWPFILVIVISVINDVFDILDVNLLFGLDQVFDLFSLVVMLGARLFIRQGSGWVASKIAAFLIEWVPFVGILPCWTIAAVYVWRRAVILRRRRHAQQLAEMRAQQEAEYEEEMAMGEEQEMDVMGPGEEEGQLSYA